MVETIRKGYWAADDATTEWLLREHVESVATHGVGCSEHTCGNPRLLRYVLEQGAVMNIPGPALEAYRAAMEEAIGADIETAAAEAEDFVRWNESRPRLTTTNIEGLRMEESADAAEPLPARPASGADDGAWAPLWVGAPLVGLLAVLALAPPPGIGTRGSPGRIVVHVAIGWRPACVWFSVAAW